MLAIVLGLFKNWRALIGVAIAFILAACIALLIHERDTARFMLLKAQQLIATQQTQIGQLQGDVSMMTAEIKRQNSAVATMADAARQAQAASAAALQQAQQRAVHDAATVSALTARAADTTNRGTCDAEIARIRAAL